MYSVLDILARGCHVADARRTQAAREDQDRFRLRELVPGKIGWR